MVRLATDMIAPSIFISYCREDERLKDRLLTHLNALACRLEIFHDRDIAAGSNWQEDIQNAIDRASVAILLISPDFLDSTFIREEEVPRLLQRQEEGLTIIPILARPAAWEEIDWLARMQWLPRNGKELSSLDRNKLDSELKSISRQVARVVEMAENQAKKSSRRHQAISIPLPGRAIVIDSYLYMYVSGGEVSIGCDLGYEHERQTHTVKLSPFFIAAVPVTNSQFMSFVEQSGYQTNAEELGYGICLTNAIWQPVARADWRHPNGRHSTILKRLHHPVVQVCWKDAVSYCNWLSDRSGFQFSLPTEAQWEYAAAGADGLTYSFGNEYDRSKANLEGEGTSLVATYAPNSAGIYDMTGNVHEWCRDWYASTWEKAGHSPRHIPVDPPGPDLGDFRILKGGSWFDGKEHSRCSNRFSAAPDLSASNWGFRPVLLLTDNLLLTLLADSRWGHSADVTLGVRMGGNE